VRMQDLSGEKSYLESSEGSTVWTVGPAFEGLPCDGGRILVSIR
jgi:hypothetical protein